MNLSTWNLKRFVLAYITLYSLGIYICICGNIGSDFRFKDWLIKRLIAVCITAQLVVLADH